jgi:FkbM family methyltransferase
VVSIAVDPRWLARNVARSWRQKMRLQDFFLRLMWIYGARRGSANRGIGARRREWTIGFRYPRPIGNVRLRVRANDGADAFIHSEVFEHEYYALPLATPPATILDLGANVGMTAVYFSRVFPDAALACVEPVPDNLRLLKKNLELNGVEAAVFAAAVDVADGRTVMELDLRDYGHRISPAPTRGEAGRIEVAAVSVPTLRQQLGWDRIGLLKIDIEGHEAALLSDGCDWLACVDALCIECHGEYGETDLDRLAHRFGFGPPRTAGGIWLMTRH